MAITKRGNGRGERRSSVMILRGRKGTIGTVQENERREKCWKKGESWVYEDMGGQRRIQMQQREVNWDKKERQ